ncbi:MAG: hypothetical protein ACTSQP_23185 [Promethearchaeota archaeon]
MFEKKLDVLIVNEPEFIFNYLQLGINLPILPSFKEFILHDLKVFNSKSILLLEDGDICGHTLIYFFNKECLYFGFFKVENHIPTRINFLISQIEKFAKENKFKSICGPINIPTIIYGWGFSDKNSRDTIFIENPYSPIIYIKLFKENNFQIYKKYFSYEGKTPIIPPERFKNCKIDDYKFFTLKNWNEIESLRESIFSLIINNMPPVATITPHPEKTYNNSINIVKKFGLPELLVIIKHKNTNKLIAFFIGIPNFFQFDDNNKFSSFVIYLGIVDKNHRRKGIGLEMSRILFQNAIRNNITRILAPVSAEIESSQDIATNLYNLCLTRKFLIFKKKL